MDDDQALEQLLRSKVVPSEDDDLDAELETLMREDKLRSENFNDMGDIDFIQDVAVFDPLLSASDDQDGEPHAESLDEEESASLGEVAKKEKGLSLPKLPFPKLHFKKPDKLTIIAMALSAMIIATAAVFAILYFTLSEKGETAEMEEAPAGAVILEPPLDAVNDSSYIFLGNMDSSGMLGQRLSRFAIGPLSTLAYLSEPLGDRYSLSLRNLDGTPIGRDLTLSLPGNIAAFRPLKANPGGFSLVVEDKLTGETEQMDFSLKRLPYERMRSLESPIPVFDGSNALEIISASFSNTGSTVCMRFNLGNTGDIMIDGSSTVSLLEGASPLFARSPAGKAPVKYSKDCSPLLLDFNRSILARVDFEPARSLDDVLTMAVKGLYLESSPNLVMETSELFNFAEKGPQSKSIGDYKLVFEGMQKQGKYIVMVLHCETPDGKRTEASLATELHGEDPFGKEIIIAGECISGNQGSDILFDIEKSPIILNPENLKVKLKSATIKMPEISFHLDLSQMATSLPEDAANAQRALEMSFVGRLRYKSKTLGLSDVSGFAYDVLTDPQLMKLYEPMASDSSEFSAQTAICAITGNTLQGGVNEAWKAISGGRTYEFERHHKIEAIKGDNGWVITSDEVMEK
jgi:hypothetical protein